MVPAIEIIGVTRTMQQLGITLGNHSSVFRLHRHRRHHNRPISSPHVDFLRPRHNDRLPDRRDPHILANTMSTKAAAAALPIL